MKLRPYFLTLLRTPQRAEAIMRELFRAGFASPRCVLGVDAADGIDHLPWWRPARQKWWPKWGRVDAVIACAASHLRIYAEALQRQTSALIFEDDTRLFVPASEFHSAIAEAPEGWDLIHFHGPAHYDGIVERAQGHTARLRALETVGFGAVAYAVSAAGIYKIMRAAYPLDRPIDVTIREIPNLCAYRTAQPYASRDGAFRSELR